MARANLNIQTQVTEAFLQAQDSKDVRIIKVKIENEDLTLDGVINSIGTEQEDFESLLVTSLEDTQASFALFNLSTGAAENGSLKWLMVAWVPDGCRVRDKMLYSSSREDLKRSLGLGYFSAEYAANQRSDLTWNQFQDSLQKHHTPDIYTESERLVREEKVQVQAESSTSKSNALGVLPFKFSSGLEEQLVAFNSSTSATNWVEMRLENEVVEAVSNRVVAADERFQPFVDTQNVSFLAVKLPHSAAAAAAAAPSNAPFLSISDFNSNPSYASVHSAGQYHHRYNCNASGDGISETQLAYASASSAAAASASTLCRELNAPFVFRVLHNNTQPFTTVWANYQAALRSLSLVHIEGHMRQMSRCLPPAAGNNGTTSSKSEEHEPRLNSSTSIERLRSTIHSALADIDTLVVSASQILSLFAPYSIPPSSCNSSVSVSGSGTSGASSGLSHIGTAAVNAMSLLLVLLPEHVSILVHPAPPPAHSGVVGLDDLESETASAQHELRVIERIVRHINAVATAAASSSTGSNVTDTSSGGTSLPANPSSGGGGGGGDTPAGAVSGGAHSSGDSEWTQRLPVRSNSSWKKRRWFIAASSPQVQRSATIATTVLQNNPTAANSNIEIVNLHPPVAVSSPTREMLPEAPEVPEVATDTTTTTTTTRGASTCTADAALLQLRKDALSLASTRLGSNAALVLSDQLPDVAGNIQYGLAQRLFVTAASTYSYIAAGDVNEIQRSQNLDFSDWISSIHLDKREEPAERQPQEEELMEKERQLIFGLARAEKEEEEEEEVANRVEVVLGTCMKQPSIWNGRPVVPVVAAELNVCPASGAMCVSTRYGKVGTGVAMVTKGCIPRAS
mmetsp:Transcript_27043/g.45284  ORF Transcript_27043/g.45284 Transcript_27043/m.45284 type:complete len:852 (-) Transcript_27043:160-2715(-)